MNKTFPVSVVIPMRNSATTVFETLRSVVKQKYSIAEIIVIDNASKDNSRELVSGFAKKTKIPIILIKRKKNKGVGASYNLGAKRAKAAHVVFIHSDSSLPTVDELTKLTEPMRQNLAAIATYSTIIMPESIWNTYNFWQKCLFARSVGRESPGFNGKFDCVRKDIFLKVGGFNDKNFGEDIGIGGEDADLYLSLETKGKIVLGKAKVIHLHFMGHNYALSNWIRNRKLLARSYGRLLRLRGGRLPLATSGKGLSVPLGGLVFIIKPTLAIIPFIPHLHLLGIALLLLYSVFYSKKMYTTVSILSNPRIFLLPFIDIFLVYYETFWMLEAFFIMRKNGV